MKFGDYYNYCAASAGSYCYGDGANVGTPVDKPNTDIDAEYDICPSGWRMPTGGASGEYQALATIIKGGSGDITDSTKYTAFRNTLSLPLPGRFRDGRARTQGLDGFFWSSTYGDSIYIYSLKADTTISPQYGGYRHYGNSVRCVAQ